MKTILIPCRVPWMISASMSGIELTHAETDTPPECRVTFGVSSLSEDSATLQSCVVQIEFEGAYYARCGPHDDSESIEAVGYTVDGSYDGNIDTYLDWLNLVWRETGNCPDSGFYVAETSHWLDSIKGRWTRDCRHYVVDGRDGYVEIIAQGFKWREWLWSEGHRDNTIANDNLIASGHGID